MLPIVFQRTALALLVALAVSTTAIAADPVTLTTAGLVEVETLNTKGEKEITRVPAGKLIPGMTVIFVNTAVNNGTAASDNVAVNNPIPEHTTYVDGSAKGEGVAISFSVDGGKSYNQPAQLKVKGADGKLRPATAADYTHIRWQLNKPLPPKGTVAVEYSAKVK